MKKEKKFGFQVFSVCYLCFVICFCCYFVVLYFWVFWQNVVLCIYVVV